MMRSRASLPSSPAVKAQATTKPSLTTPRSRKRRSWAISSPTFLLIATATTAMCLIFTCHLSVLQTNHHHHGATSELPLARQPPSHRIINSESKIDPRTDQLSAAAAQSQQKQGSPPDLHHQGADDHEDFSKEKTAEKVFPFQNQVVPDLNQPGYYVNKSSHPQNMGSIISDSEGLHISKIHLHRKVRTDNVNVFYNYYMNPEAPRRSRDIAREQMRQIANSTIATNNTVYYNVIGLNFSQGIDPCDEQTNLITCVRMNYYPEGNEELTLQALYDHCQSHPVNKVVYMHNKGSFRKERGNTKIRRLSTTAVTSHACLEMPLSEETYPCNVCGLTFQSKPYFHMTANHWVAECSYVRELIPPKVYTVLRTDFVQRLWKEQPCLGQGYDGVFDVHNITFLKEFGLGRYAMERWLASHPSLIPCDVIPFRISRFRRGFEDWFNPTLRVSRHMMFDTAEESERREIWMMRREFEHMYGGGAHKKTTKTTEPNFVFMNYTGNVEPNPCL